jgi:sugar lactone lactonase YvrE
MRQAWRAIAGLLAIGALTAGGTVALADDGGGRGGRDDNGDRGDALATVVFTMLGGPNGDGNPEGVAFDKSSGRLFVSRTRTAAIFSGALSAPTTPLTTFIAGRAPSPNVIATGLKVRNGLLYVAGATTGEIRVYDLANPAAAPKVFQTGGGFINDLDLDEDGDVFATDSSQSTIYELTAAQVAAGSGTPRAIDVSSGITSTAGQTNMNGIVVNDDGDELIVVTTFSGELFRITLRGAPATASVEKIAVQGGDGNVKDADGLLVDRGRLLVVRHFTPHAANGAVQAFKLSHHRTRARFESETTDPSLAFPSTIARADNRLLVVNADFPAGPNAAQYTVTGLARNAIRHGDEGDEHHEHHGRG